MGQGSADAASVKTNKAETARGIDRRMADLQDVGLSRGERAGPPRISSAAGAQELDVPGGGAHLQRRAAAIQLAFRAEAPGSRPIAAFADDADVAEVGHDLVP